MPKSIFIGLIVLVGCQTHRSDSAQLVESAPVSPRTPVIRQTAHSSPTEAISIAMPHAEQHDLTTPPSVALDVAETPHDFTTSRGFGVTTNDHSATLAVKFAPPPCVPPTMASDGSVYYGGTQESNVKSQARPWYDPDMESYVPKKVGQ